MNYDLGLFDDECARIECAEYPFGAKVLPMCPEWTFCRLDLRPMGAIQFNR